MSEQNQAAWTFGLFIRLVQAWCTSLEEQTTQEFQSFVSSLEVFGSRRPSPYFDHVSLISLRHLESVVKTEEISIFFWKFCFFHLHGSPSIFLTYIRIWKHILVYILSIPTNLHLYQYHI